MTLPVDGVPAGVLCYVSRAPARADAARAPTVVMLTDVFGMAFVNNKLLADSLASHGNVDVLVPDYLGGDPMPAAALEGGLDSEAGWTFSSVLGVLPWAPRIASWFWSHSASVTAARVAVAARAARAWAAANGSGRVGFAGYCFGGQHAVAAGAAGGAADAVAVIHPGGVPQAAIDALAVPTIWCLAPVDVAFNDAAVAAAKAALSRKAPPLQGTWRVYEGAGVRHGFAVRGPPSSDAAKGACAADVGAFFAKMLA